MMFLKQIVKKNTKNLKNFSHFSISLDLLSEKVSNLDK